jgi:hypothetical protein
MVSSGLLRRVALVRTDVSEEPGASFIRVTKIGDRDMTQGHSATQFPIHSLLTLSRHPSTEAWDLALSRAI